jgi:hypothetical protein
MAEDGLHRARPAPSGAAGSGALALWWAIAGSLASFVAAWPWIGGLVAMNDDLKFVRIIGRDGLWERIAHAWTSSATFRPMELAVGWTCDPWSLSPGAVPWVQAAGVLAFCAAVARVARLAWPSWPSAAPIAIVLAVLSPAASVSAWQADTCSQTWTAALGLWSSVFAWRAVKEGRGRMPGAMPLAGLVAALVIGVLAKENMYGWGLGLALACAAASLASFASARDRAWRAAWVAVPCIAVPAAHAALRWTTGGLGSVSTDGDASRYSVELGTNLVVNAAMSVGALLGNGPFHLLTDDAAHAALRVLPFVAVLAALMLVGVAATFAWINRGGAGATGRRGEWGNALLLLLVAAASLAPTLPMGQVGELYGMGANAATAVLVAGCACALWSPAARDEVAIGRGVAALGLSALVAIGALGLAGRAGHFRASWATARVLNDRIVSRARDAEASGHDLVVYFGAPCLNGRTYGQYVCPAVQALDVAESSKWLDAATPRARVLLTSEVPSVQPGADDLVLDCIDLPARPSY